MKEINRILKKYWGFNTFRPLQSDIIESVLNGNDTLALLPTGGGKSVCYQVPALAMNGLCLVVTPLIALMKDQVDALKRKGIPALMIHSGMTSRDVKKTLQNATTDYFKFLYVSPERLETSLFKEYLPALDVQLIAVDEAHCISQWGYDFRPSYLKIAELRKELPDVPVLAVTASATPEVQNDIIAQLNFRSNTIFKQSFERANLSYEVIKSDAKIPALLALLSTIKGSTIIYCRSRKRTQEISNLINLQGQKSIYYHAGLTQEERNKKQKLWMDNQVRTIVCTNAFGMGIDKPDVRLVVHIDVPDCIENYYQEAGRAGRDGTTSTAALLSNDTDTEKLENEIALKFPTQDRIRIVYQSLCNFLQVPSFSGSGTNHRFDFELFIRNFKLNANEAYNCLKILEQDGHISFREQNFIPPTLVFQTSKKELYEFEKVYPQYEELLTTLLRVYEGIFDFPAFISENYISRILKKQEHEIISALKEVARFNIISYTPLNQEPQILFLKNRVPAEELKIDVTAYEKRKEAAQQRVKAMINYLQNDCCRSRKINEYFGEVNTPDCGICDVCKSRKKEKKSSDEFDQIYSSIKNVVSNQSLNAKQLIKELKDYDKEMIWEMIEFLHQENKLTTSEAGNLKWN